MPIVNLYDPVKKTGETELNLDSTNNNTGSTYDSGLLNESISLLAYNPSTEVDSLWELPANQSNYADIQEMVNAWQKSITGEVSNGWSLSSNADGSFNTTNIGGIPDTSYDSWTDDSSQNNQAYTFIVPDSQLSLNGLAGYTATDFGTILKSTDITDNAFVATQDSLNSYTVIP